MNYLTQTFQNPSSAGADDWEYGDLLKLHFPSLCSAIASARTDQRAESLLETLMQTVAVSNLDHETKHIVGRWLRTCRRAVDFYP